MRIIYHTHQSYFFVVLTGSMKAQVQARTTQQLGGLMETVVRVFVVDTI